MKRFFTGLLLATLLFTFALRPMAAVVTYPLQDLKLSVAIPDDWVVITKDKEIPKDELTILGIDSEKILETMAAQNIYLDALSSTPFSELVVTMTSNASSEKVFDFNRYSSEELMSIAQETISSDSGKAQGITYSNPVQTENAQGKFITLSFTKTVNDKTVYGLRSYTVINGKTVSVILSSYAGEVTEKQRQILTDVVSSVHFDEVKPVPNGPTLWVVLGIVAGVLLLITVFFYFLLHKKRR